MSKFFELFTRPVETNSGTRGGIFAVVGGYIIYMGTRMLENTKSGLSEMSMSQTILLAVMMFVVGAAVIVYGAVLFLRGWRQQQAAMEENIKSERKSSMKIYSVYDDEFKAYGKVLEGYDTEELIGAMNAIPLPEEGVSYEPGIASLEACAIYTPMQNKAYGGMPIQIGMCWGHNTLLNCLEYHKDSEINIGANDFVLLVAKEEEIIDGVLDTACVKAFLAPAGKAVEVYATTLHYAPCHTDVSTGFRTAIVLPKGTNYAMPEIEPANEEDKRLWASNKWLLAHPDTSEAKSGAYVGLKGENIDIA